MERQRVDPYRSLAVELIRAAAKKKEFQTARRQLLLSEAQIESWLAGKTDVRLSIWLLLWQRLGIQENELANSILAPQTFPVSRKCTTSPLMLKHVVAPLLRILRGDHTLKEVAQILKIRAHATYGHWEQGRRDIPLTDFLKVIDLLAGRLPVLSEMMGLEKDLSAHQFKSVPRPTDFSDHFFRYPWTPSVYLAIVTGQLKPQSFKVLGLTPDEVRISLKTLFDLRLLRVEKKEYKIQKDYFYAPTSLDPKILSNLNSYWFSKSQKLSQLPGLHKIDEVTVARDSIPQIAQWIGELREKIRNESKKCKPETILHFHWQMVDLHLET